MSRIISEVRIFIYEVPHKLWNLISNLRSIFVKVFGDPSVCVGIHGHKMYMPLSHNLPIYVRRFPYYDTVLTRISKFMRRKKENINYIDVGANIGDSILAVNPKQKDRIVAVEPNSNFNKYIRKNLKDFPYVQIQNVICSSSSSKENIRILEKNGTARIVSDNKSALLVKKTLNDIVAEASMERVDLIKTDTDGHDFEILKGAYSTIKRDHPVIFFECDSFGNKNYIKDVLNFFEFLKQNSYKSVLLYDNYGFLLGRFSLNDTELFKNLLSYQLNSNFYYYDILVMEEKDIVEFESLEKKKLWRN